MLALIFASVIAPKFANAYDPNNPSDVYNAIRQNSKAKQDNVAATEGIAAKLARVEAEVADIEQVQIPAANAAAEVANTNYKTAVEKAEKLARRLAAAQADKERIETQLDTATQEFNSSKEAVAALAREEMRGDKEFQSLNLIISAQDSNEFVESLETQSAAARTQARVLNNAALVKADAGTKDARLKIVNDLIAKLKQEADENEQAAAKAKAQAEQWQQEVKSLQAQLVSKHADLEHQKANLEAMKAQIEAEEASLSADLAAIASRPGNDGFDGSGGVLSYPVGDHRITAGFHDPQYYAQFGWPHNGVDFGYVGCGTPIHAAADGRVDISSYNTARGNYVVVNHGNNAGTNLMTVYQHMPYGGVYVSQGQWVTRGQVVGTVGGGPNGTGASTGCHLHFEVWVNGSPVNPMGYF